MASSKRIVLAGSTGDIGQKTITVAAARGIEISALSCNSSIDLLRQQAEMVRPKYLVVAEPASYSLLKQAYSGPCEVLFGKEGIAKACEDPSVDTVVNAAVGIAGLDTSLQAIKNRKRLALANKETLVTAGELVMDSARRMNVDVIPIDSEHSAIFQCLQGNRREDLETIILTCSGGPFRGRKRADLQDVSVAQALGHPKWKMGDIVTIQSAELANKGREVIEAYWLFGLKTSQIEVVIHPESIIHSAVQYKDGTTMAQMSIPDMRIPIQYSLTYPERPRNLSMRINFKELQGLNFEEPDMETFKPLRLAFDVLERPGTTAGAAFNGADEMVVNLFRNKQIGFLQMGDITEAVMSEYEHVPATIENVIATDEWARARVVQLARKGN